jgi:predicted phosphohydrolase
MRVFAISDLHLSFSGKKPMDLFGEHWSDHHQQVERAWRETVGAEDVVCLSGDFSWSSKLDEVQVELDWLEALPGKKVMIKGNHDYWWSSPSKVRKALGPDTYIIQNDSVTIGGVAFAGARGWVDGRLDFSKFSGHAEAVPEGGAIQGDDADRGIYERDLGRLEMSLKRIDKGAELKIALLHFPPTSPALEDTEVTKLLEEHGVDVAVFGHIHRSAPTAFKNPFGERGGVKYYLASADFIDFAPIEIASI